MEHFRLRPTLTLSWRLKKIGGFQHICLLIAWYKYAWIYWCIKIRYYLYYSFEHTELQNYWTISFEVKKATWKFVMNQHGWVISAQNGFDKWFVPVGYQLPLKATSVGLALQYFSWYIDDLLFDYKCMRLPLIPWPIAGVPSSQALLGFPITAPPPVCVPTVIGALAEWRQNKKKKNRRRAARRQPRQGLLALKQDERAWLRVFLLPCVST